MSESTGVQGQAKEVLVESFTVGWIAALPHELTAAIEMLDEEFLRAPRDFERHARDTNSYCWGRTGDHYVVMASLPAGEDGTTAATVTAERMISSLPRIRFGLLVGIGAGVPWTIGTDGEPVLSRDIRLGDVVVSQPEGTSSGVVCYDHGKALQGQYELKGALDRPPTILLTALSRLKAQYMRGRRGLDQALAKLLKNNELDDFAFPGRSADDLHDHLKKQDETKKKRKDPTIHYGVIASGNSVIKSVEERTRILKLLHAQNIKLTDLEDTPTDWRQRAVRKLMALRKWSPYNAHENWCSQAWSDSDADTGPDTDSDTSLDTDSDTGSDANSSQGSMVANSITHSFENTLTFADCLEPSMTRHQNSSS